MCGVHICWNGTSLPSAQNTPLVCSFASLLPSLLVCLFACLFACLLVCLLVCFLSCLLVCLLVCLFASFLPSFFPSFLPSFLPSFFPSFLPSFLPFFLSSFLPFLLLCLLLSFLPYYASLFSVISRLPNVLFIIHCVGKQWLIMWFCSYEWKMFTEATLLLFFVDSVYWWINANVWKIKNWNRFKGPG